jgi:hypothetical protein
MKSLHWFVGTLAAAVIATFVAEFWALIKAGALFDFLESAAGQVQQAHFIRTDLVSSGKQALAQWILAVSCVVGWILTVWTRARDEPWIDSFMFGIAYGFTLGLGLLFLLSNFGRFKDVHLAVGDAQYGLAGIAMISTFAMAMAYRFRERRET